MAEKILKSNVQEIESEFKTFGALTLFKLQQLSNESICLIDAQTEEQLTVSSLKSRSNSIAVALINRGITKTDRIAFCGQNSIQHSILRFVSYFTGNTFLPLDTSYTPKELEEKVISVEITVLMISAQVLHKFETIITNNNLKLVVVFDGKNDKYVTFDELLEEGRDQTLDRIPYFDVNPEKDMLFLIHTSGSTGRPKCVMISHKTIINSDSVSNNRYTGHTGPRSVIGVRNPLAHIIGTTNIPNYIMNGSTVVLFGDNDNELILKSIQKYRINVLPILSFIARNFIEGESVDKYDLSSLTLISTGAGLGFTELLTLNLNVNVKLSQLSWKILEKSTPAPLPHKLAQAIVDKYAIKYKQVYSMTEYRMITMDSDPDDKYTPGCVGRVSNGTELKIVDLTTGQSLGPDIDGEIYIRGNRMFAGYMNNDSENREAFDRDGWFRTGDIGHYDEKERLFITGRVKEMLSVHENNDYVIISPVEIETFLLTNKSIADVLVIGVNNSIGFQWPRAYVQFKTGHMFSAESIKKFVSDNLSISKQLKGGVVFVDRIHRTSIGKIDRKYYRNLIKDEIID